MADKRKTTKTRLKKNDTVKVISGNSRGAVGKVLFINNEKGSLIVEGVNIVHRHTKPNQTETKWHQLTKKDRANTKSNYQYSTKI